MGWPDYDEALKVLSSQFSAESASSLTILPTFLVRASPSSEDDNHGVKARVLADGGSQLTFCDQRLCERLKLQTVDTGLTYRGLGGNRPKSAKVATLYLHSLHSDFSLRVEAAIVPKITGKFQSAPFHPLEEYPSARKFHLPLADEWPQEEGITVDLLLGQDYYWSFMGSKAYRPLEANTEMGPIFLPTKFGLLFQGCVGPGKGINALVANKPLEIPKAVSITKEKEQPLDKLLKQLFDLECIGIHIPEETKLRPKEKFAIDFLEANMTYLEDENRFQVKLPWDPKKSPLVNNVYTARSRLLSLMNHLKRSEFKRNLYIQGMEKYITKGHCREVTEDDEKADEIFYLPHSGVLQPNAKGELKLRIVFDCSHKDRNGLSLNEKLTCAAVPEANIIRIITSWRRRKFALNTDIKECFLNIRLHRCEQNKFRFLWIRPGETTPRHYAFTSLLFGSKASPWISSTCLWKLLDRHVKKYPRIVEQTKRGLYVDDILVGFDSIAEAQKFIEIVTNIFLQGSFGLAKFVSSHDEILKNVEEEKCLFPKDTKKKGSVKTLGVQWDLDDDLMFIDRELEKAFYHGKAHDTKRTVSRMVATVFDPLGILAPWVVEGKLILRDTWLHHGDLAEKANMEKACKKFWDLPLPDNLQKRVNHWKQDCGRASELKMGRRLIPHDDMTSIELYGFSDASPLIFGACVYAKANYRSKPSTSMFIASKNKVNTKLTLPKAELMGARLLALFVHCIKEYLELPEDTPCFLFSDSMVTLHWIRQDHEKWTILVSNAVKEIQQYSKIEQWHHVPGEENPSDLLTRPKTMEELLQDKDKWLHGPAFIRTGKLPVQPDFDHVPDEAGHEFKASIKAEHIVMAATKSREDDPVRRLVERVTDIVKILRILIRVKYAFQKTAPKPLFSTETMRQACDHLARIMQADAFPEVLKAVQANTALPNKSRLSDFDPFLDDNGLLRAGGRLSAAEHLPYDQRHPILLPSTHELLAKLIVFVHECNAHIGYNWVHQYLRRRFWILRGKHSVRKYITRCVRCKRYSGSLMSQKIAPLPDIRLEPTVTPFKNVALDAMGPLNIQFDYGSTPETRKVWVLVLTCPTTRAINLETLPKLTTEAFITCMRRHIAEWGMPSTVRLDNFRSHISMSKELTALFDGAWPKDLREKSHMYGIKWSWSQPLQPSTNGVVEICVKLAKEAIKKTVHRDTISYEDLITLLREARRVINSRPLIALSDGELDAEGPLTPNHLIYGHPISCLPFLEEQCRGKMNPSLREVWSQRQKLIKRFSGHFMTSYVSSLLQLKIWKKAEPPAEEGDVCLVAEPLAGRRDWPLAIVEEVKKGRDGLVRSCVLRMVRGTTTKSKFSLHPLIRVRRSVRSIVPLHKDPGAGIQDDNDHDSPAASQDSPPSIERDAQETTHPNEVKVSNVSAAATAGIPDPTGREAKKPLCAHSQEA